jgi:hypothetical protein
MDCHIKFEVNCDLLKVLNLRIEDLNSQKATKYAYKTSLKQQSDIQKR